MARSPPGSSGPPPTIRSVRLLQATGTPPPATTNNPPPPTVIAFSGMVDTSQGGLGDAPDCPGFVLGVVGTADLDPLGPTQLALQPCFTFPADAQNTYHPAGAGHFVLTPSDGTITGTVAGPLGPSTAQQSLAISWILARHRRHRRVLRRERRSVVRRQRSLTSARRRAHCLGRSNSRARSRRSGRREFLAELVLHDLAGCVAGELGDEPELARAFVVGEARLAERLQRLDGAARCRRWHTTNAPTSSPSTVCGTPMTAASCTSGCSSSTASTSVA